MLRLDTLIKRKSYRGMNCLICINSELRHILFRRFVSTLRFNSYVLFRDEATFHNKNVLRAQYEQHQKWICTGGRASWEYISGAVRRPQPRNRGLRKSQLFRCVKYKGAICWICLHPELRNIVFPVHAFYLFDSLFFKDEAVFADKQIRLHELDHFRRWKEEGDNFNIRYSRFSKYYGYRDNPYELAAWAAAVGHAPDHVADPLDLLVNNLTYQFKRGILESPAGCPGRC